jgi:hypothetical protein
MLLAARVIRVFSLVVLRASEILPELPPRVLRDWPSRQVTPSPRIDSMGDEYPD